jgi:3-oxoacyl-[acyl-carrier-protein] synthase II
MISKPNKRRVVVTGIGAITPIGNNLESTWKGILEGKSVGAKVTKYDAELMPNNIAYEISGFKFDPSGFSKEEQSEISDIGEFAITAAREAIAESGLKDFDKHRTQVYLGVGMQSPTYKWYEDHLAKDNYQDELLKRHDMFKPATITKHVGKLVGAKGGCFTVHTACASSGQAVGEAFEAIAYGDADVVLAGGADSMINPFHTAGFCLLGALATDISDPKTASRPFDENRSGFVLGEGACVFTLESLEHAEKRGAKILGEIVGYGVSESAYRITDLHPEGKGPIEAMTMAVEDAGIKPEEVGYLNAHGTSTKLNDQIESLAVSKVFPKESCNLHVSSTKSMTGHMISAAGAIELATCILALRDQMLPPSVNLKNQDPACDVTLTPNQPSEKTMNYALSNSVGFGGSNTAIIAKRFN